MEEHRVRIYHGTEIVATHVRSTEPFARVIDTAHYAGCGAGRRTPRWPRGWCTWDRTSRTAPPSWTVANEGHSRACRRAAQPLTPKVYGRSRRCRTQRGPAHGAHLCRSPDGVLRREVDAKQRTRVAMGLKIAHFRTLNRTGIVGGSIR
jgi:hypothetical protein